MSNLICPVYFVENNMIRSVIILLILLESARPLINEPPHDKTSKMTCAPSEDSHQPGRPPSLIRIFAVNQLGHPPSLIRVFAVRSMSAWRKLRSLATH